jgi:hypothetical protein
MHTVLPAELLPPGLTGRLQVAVRGLDVALAPEGSPVRLSLDGSVSWASARGTETTTAVAWPKGEGHLLAGIYDERQERTFLACISPGGEARIVAEVTGAPPDSDGGIHAIAYDEARGVVWVAGGFGVMAFQPKS